MATAFKNGIPVEILAKFNHFLCSKYSSFAKVLTTFFFDGVSDYADYEFNYEAYVPAFLRQNRLFV